LKRAGIISKAMRRSARREPLEVVLSFKVRFGEAPHEQVTLVDERRLPLVGSVFDNRDRIAREFLRLLVKAGVRRPSRLLGPRKAQR
jgi:hypothetical protein